MLPSISIIVPTFNVAPYIHKCLDSVASQTYTGPIECLIIDDCGTDDSIQIAESFISEYKGTIDFRIVYRERNGGLSAARNTGIRESKGDYLYFLDSDDWIIPECIELLVECLKKYPKAEIVQAGAKVIGEGFSWMDFEKKNLPEYSDDKEWIKKAFCACLYLNMTAWNKLLKKSFILGNDLYFKEGIIHEDEILNIQLAIHTSRLAICRKNTYVYLVRDSSIMGQRHQIDMEMERRIECWKQMLHIIAGKNDNILACSLFYFANQSYWCLGKSSYKAFCDFQSLMIHISKEATGIKRLYMFLWTILSPKIRTLSFVYNFINKETRPIV